MRVLICGSRTWRDRATIERVIAALPEGAVIIHGGQRSYDRETRESYGADYLAGECAKARGFTVEEYPADWHQYGPASGPIRNTKMLKEGKPDCVFAFRMPGKSNGTDDMCRKARAGGVQVQVVQPS